MDRCHARPDFDIGETVVVFSRLWSEGLRASKELAGAARHTSHGTRLEATGLGLSDPPQGELTRLSGVSLRACEPWMLSPGAGIRRGPGKALKHHQTAGLQVFLDLRP